MRALLLLWAMLLPAVLALARASRSPNLRAPAAVPSTGGAWAEIAPALAARTPISNYTAEAPESTDKQGPGTYMCCGSPCGVYRCFWPQACCGPPPPYGGCC